MSRRFTRVTSQPPKFSDSSEEDYVKTPRTIPTMAESMSELRSTISRVEDDSIEKTLSSHYHPIPQPPTRGPPIDYQDLQHGNLLGMHNQRVEDVMLASGKCFAKLHSHQTSAKTRVNEDESTPTDTLRDAESSRQAALSLQDNHEACQVPRVEQNNSESERLQMAGQDRPGAEKLEHANQAQFEAGRNRNNELIEARLGVNLQNSPNFEQESPRLTIQDDNSQLPDEQQAQKALQEKLQADQYAAYKRQQEDKERYDHNERHRQDGLEQQDARRHRLGGCCWRGADALPQNFDNHDSSAYTEPPYGQRAGVIADYRSAPTPATNYNLIFQLLQVIRDELRDHRQCNGNEARYAYMRQTLPAP